MTDHRMDILLTNDDGIHAEGLWRLYHELADRFKVAVIAPDRERSAIGHAITLHQPLRQENTVSPTGIKAIAVTGTPADCVKIGLLEILDQLPRLVIAGINPGANVGVNVNYSGTVGAAREAALFGVYAISVSVASRHPQNLSGATRFIQHLATRILDHGMKRGTFLNVNLPDLPFEQMAGVRVLRHGTQFNGEHFEKRIDPRERPYYWQGCDMQTRLEAGGAPNATRRGREMDAVSLSNGYISITPIKCDTTDYDAIDEMQNWISSPFTES